MLGLSFFALLLQLAFIDEHLTRPNNIIDLVLLFCIIDSLDLELGFFCMGINLFTEFLFGLFLALNLIILLHGRCYRNF